MRPDVFHEAGKYTEKHRKKRRWYRISASLAAVVVFCTVYLLMMPAVTLERQSDLLEDTQREVCETAEEIEVEEAANPEEGETPNSEDAQEGEPSNPEANPEGETPNPEGTPEEGEIPSPEADPEKGDNPNLEKDPEKGETPNLEKDPEKGEPPNPEADPEKGETPNPEETPEEETLPPEQTENPEQPENPELSENAELPASPEMLQEDTAEGEEEEFELTACTESGIKVVVTGMSSALPCPAEEITVTAEEKDTETEEDQLFPDPMEEEQESELIGKYLLDITLKHGEEEIEPTGPVKVTFSGLPVEGCDPKIYHIDPEEQEVTDMEVDTEENGDMTITTDHFSLYQIELRATEAVAETTPGTLSGYIGNDAFKDGGSFILTGDACTYESGNQANLTITKDTTIDLNGHTLTISQSNQQFQIESGATLTILDSAADAASADKIVATASDQLKLYGNAATLKDEKLTYYITKSTPNAENAEKTGTTETLEKHELDLTKTGIIENSADAGGDQIFLVNGGNLNLNGGVLRSNVDNKRLVCVSNGAFNMSGGYIVGGTHHYGGGGVYTKGTMTMTGGVIAANKSKLGGGICVEGGTLNLSGGVIAANTSNLGGGIYAGGGTLDLSGGVVTGNQVVEEYGCGNGGGIFVTNAILKLSGNAYVTNNILQKCTCVNDVNNKHGGGGIAIGNGSTMKMSGGYVTGNDAWLAGGGIYAGFWENGAGFAMSGGTIASNHVQEGEGGGLRISGKTNGVITAAPDNKIYITNNKTETEDDWGGGGIFIQQDGKLNITNALITENSAGGFGGGIAVCPTGETLIVHSEGGAVYGNSADGKNMSDGGNGKNADTNVALVSDVFKENGYQDFFCVRKQEDANSEVSLVTGEMLGDGAANWKGSCDEQPVKISKSGYAAAKYLFGLTSDPDADAIARAKGAATVIISGNHSNIHGGGIMTNGGLILGNTEGPIVSATPSLNISGTKVLKRDEVPQSSGRKFKFQLTDETGTTNFGTATSDDSTGKFTISPNVTYTQAGTYCYYLSEVNDGKPGVVYDPARYKIEIEITEHTTELLNVKFVSYKVNSAKVTKVEKGSPETPVESPGSLNADGSYSLKIKDTAFTNTMTTPLELKIVKTDKDYPATRLPGAKFTLKKAGQETEKVETTDDSGVATFSGIEKNTTYYLYETVAPDGYMTAGPWILEIQDNKGVFYPAKENEDGTLVKTSDAGTGTPFKVTTEDTIVLEMKISDQSWGYKLPDTGGLGTTGYRTGGLALVVSALAWKYILTKRRKEDEISS